MRRENGLRTVYRGAKRKKEKERKKKEKRRVRVPEAEERKWD